MEKNGGWMAEGEYDEFVQSLTDSDPRLRQRDPKVQAQQIPYTDHGVRVVSLEVQPDDTFRRGAEFYDAEDLAAHLENVAALPGRRVVYVLEGLGPGFAGVLGQHFKLHPAFFVEHERVVVHNMMSWGESDGMPLPSFIHTRRHLEMRYFEVLSFDSEPTNFRLVCAKTGRHIGVSRDLRWDNQMDDIDHYLDVGVVRRKCGVWSRRTEGRGWDCLVICDPPVKSVRTGEGYKEEYVVKTNPYQGGYMDFVPEEDQIRVRNNPKDSGPPRTSLLEDLSFYLETHSQLTDVSTPECVSIFIKKIVASHYLKQAEHLRSTLSGVQRGLTRKQDLARMPMKKIEALWSDMEGWARRVLEYCEDLESIMLQLRIPLLQPGAIVTSPTALPLTSVPLPTPAIWQDATADYQFLHLKYRELGSRAESLSTAVTSLASIAGNRLSYKEQQRSIREAKSTKAVTLLGLVFIPLAYTSQVFSMTDPYGPGGEKFWQYFATSAPLILLVLLGYYVLDFGYNDSGTSWSVETFGQSVAEQWARLRKKGLDAEARSFT